MSMSVPVLKQRNNFILIILVLLAICIAIGLNRITSGFLGAIIIYVIFRPLNIYLQEKEMEQEPFYSAYSDTFLC